MQAKITIVFAAALALGVASAAKAQAPKAQAPKAQAQGPVPDFDYTVGPVPKNGTPPKAAPPPDTSVRSAPRQRAPKRTAQQQRAPTRIIVRPRPMLRERLDSTEFPRSDNLGFPGRNAVRQCKSWLATEYRPSGTVVTPQMRCWWQPG